ncbi:uncharacterized protein LOC117246031 isoform X2 [Epinephelus lanceolatus]
MEEISDEDSVVMLCCKEAEDSPSTPWSDSKSDCQQTDASDKVPCPTLSSQQVSSAGEEESYIEINCREEENMQDTMDTNSSTPGAQNIIHVHEEPKTERISEPVITSAHTSCQEKRTGHQMLFVEI